MKDKEWLKKSPVIRFNEIARRLKSKAYAKVFVHRMIKQGVLKKVSKGIYSTSKDIFSIASNIYYPSYISFLSASYRFGLTEIIPRVISIVTTKKHKSLEFERYTIDFIPLKEIFGYSKEGNGSSVTFMVDIEKLMIDAFLKPKNMGNFEEIKNIFEKSEKIDIEKIRHYLKKLNSNKIYRQVGYMLEEYAGIDVYGIMPINKNYYNLNPFKGNRKINKKWRLRV